MMLLISASEGSLTSSAKQVFFAHIQMKVFNTKSAILGLDFLLLSLADVVGRALALLRGVLAHDDVVCHLRGD